MLRQFAVVIGLALLVASCAPSDTGKSHFPKSPFPNRGVLVKPRNTEPAASVYCGGATGHVLIGTGPTYVDCGTAPPPTCTPPAVWNGTACVVPPVTCPCSCTPPAVWNGTACAVPPPTCTPPEVLQNGACVIPPTDTGINHCAASQTSTVFSSGVTLTRQCTGNVTFYHGYHAPYPGPNLFRLDVAFADALHPGPWADLISGYTALIPVGAGSYVSLGFNATIPGQMQFTSDPSGGPAGVISISRRPGVFAIGDPDLVVSPVYGPCVYTYGASNSIWFGMGADCPLTQGADYYLNFAPVVGDGSPFTDYAGILSYSEVAGH